MNHGTAILTFFYLLPVNLVLARQATDNFHELEVGSEAVPYVLTEEQITKSIANMDRAIRGCVRQQQQRNPNLAGPVEISFSIQSDGRVGRVEVISEQHVKTYVADCLTYMVKSIRFPRFSGPTVTARRLFHLNEVRPEKSQPSESVASSGESNKPTSEELIDKALVEGRIDEETALIYKVFAAFGDTRLPPEYTGDDSRILCSPIMSVVGARFSKLSPKARKILEPFFETPKPKGKWLPSSIPSHSEKSETP